MQCETELDLEAIRRDFPMLERDGLIYLDTAATSLKPKPVIDAVSRYYGQDYGTVHRAVYGLASKATEMYDQVRTKVCQFVGANRPEEIIFTHGATEGINVVAATLGESIEEGDEVLISAMEHHSNLVPWQILCMRKKAHLKVIPVSDDGDLDLDAYREVLSDRVKIVAIAHVTNVTATIYPVKEVTKLAHDAGAYVLIDGAQAVPHLPIDVIDLDVDFYVFSAHKLYGPTGAGVLYGKYDLLCAMPPYQGGGDMIEDVTYAHTSYQMPPLKFEAGTPAISSILGLGAAIDYLNEIDMNAVAEWEHRLIEHALERLQRVKGVTILGNPSQRGSGITFTVEGCHPLDIGSLLDLKNICVRTGHLCAQPTMRRFGIEHAIRISVGMYNHLSDIDACIDALEEAIQSLS